MKNVLRSVSKARVGDWMREPVVGKGMGSKSFGGAVAVSAVGE